MTDIDSSSAKTIIMGDFNMKSIVNDAKYNEKIIDHMKTKYNMMQYINECTTEHKSILDLCFATCDITSTVIWNHWSDHSLCSMQLIICISINISAKNGNSNKYYNGKINNIY